MTSKLYCVSSGVHLLQVVALSSVRNQSSNVIVIFSAVNESIGGNFPWRSIETGL